VDHAWRTLELATRYAEHGVVGIGLAADESYSLRPLAEVLGAGRDAGLHLVHHAGEVCGPRHHHDHRADRQQRRIQATHRPELLLEEPRAHCLPAPAPTMTSGAPLATATKPPCAGWQANSSASFTNASLTAVAPTKRPHGASPESSPKRHRRLSLDMMQP
jgi:hypothetical protein